MELLSIILIVAVIVLAIKLTATHGKLARAEREIKEYNEFIACGVTDYEYKKELPSSIGIYAKGLHGYPIVIKRYLYTDLESRDYAIRCAEELIEKLREEI